MSSNILAKQTTIYHRTHHDGRELAWQPDAAGAARAMPWAGRRADALLADLRSMADYFPHWVLVATLGGRAATCAACAAPGVPADGAVRCPGCWAPLDADGLRWVGHLPALSRPEPRFRARADALRAGGFEDVAVGERRYLLIPLSATYPAEWPNVEPAIRYAARWLDLAGLPRASAGHHLVGVGQACLYAWGEWQAQTIASVLQQRVVNHAASLLKIVAGAAPAAAFIGRAHGSGEQWDR
jgi:hypothetical protein